MSKSEFLVKATGDGDFVVIRQHRHSHFASKKGALDLIDILCKGRLPKSDYFIEASKRLLSTAEFMALNCKSKQRYLNQKRGMPLRVSLLNKSNHPFLNISGQLPNHRTY